jgi:signal transduction histidine kinase
LKLGSKLVLIAALPALLVGLSLGIYSANQQTRALQEAFEKRGETLARILAEQLSPSVAAGDDLDKILRKTLDPLWEEADLLSVEIVNVAGVEVASRAYLNDSQAVQPFVCKRPLLAPALPGEDIRDMLGLIIVSIDAFPVLAQQNSIYRVSLSVALGVGLFASLLAGIFGQLITGPLRSLSGAAQQISLGKYDISVQTRGDDEISLLGESFNQMSNAINERDTSLRSSRDEIQQQADELTLLTESLQKSLKEREILEATKETLSDMIIHDLKSPLAAITSAAQLLLDSVSSDDRPFVEGMISRTGGLLGMIQDLLTIRRMEEAGLPLLPSEFDLNELSREVSHHMEPVAREFGTRIEVLGGTTPVKADRQLISRILENLLSNAIKYHQSAQPVRIELSTTTEGTLLRVIDKGKGIPLEYQRSIFERFHQVLAPGSTARQGSGLGLTFCRMAIEAHRGKIWVDSKDGEGAAFSILIPPHRETFE